MECVEVLSSFNMRLKISIPKAQTTNDVITTVGWANSQELFACSDTTSEVSRWSSDGDYLDKCLKFPPETYVLDMQWLPANVRGAISGGSNKRSGSGGGSNSSDMFAASCSNGKVLLVSRGGRLERTIDGHKGAVLSLRWNYDGTALVTAGEDGQVKIWSRSGMLRSGLVALESPIYAVAWGPDSNSVLYATGKTLCVKPLQPSGKELSWKAHEGVVLKCEWNVVNNCIVSGGEDRRYKVWDSYGRNIYSSHIHDFPITCVSWSPEGDVFAVGSFNTLRLCDKSGWSYSLEKPDIGSTFQMSWSSDGTQLAGATGCGKMFLAHIVERRSEWRNYEVKVKEDNGIVVRDVLLETQDTLDFRDRVIKLSLGFDHLVVATSSQCFVYSSTNWNTPIIFDLRDSSVNMLMQSSNQFLLADNASGIQVFSYEGRLLSNPRLSGMATDLLNQATVTLSDDTLAVRDRNDEKTVHIFNTATSKGTGDGPVRHNIEILQASLSQCGSSNERFLAIIDKNQDLYLTPVNHSSYDLVKLGSMVSTVAWNDTSNQLAGVMDGMFVNWHFPNVVYVDRDMVQATRTDRDGTDLGKNPTIIHFIGDTCTVRRANGALISLSVSPYPALLHEHVQNCHWEDAVRLCRYVKNNVLWATLAAMAIQGKELNTAEVAYAAIDEIHKVEYVSYIKEMPTIEGRNAALALFRHQNTEAEAILLQAGLIYRAIEMNIESYSWDRALELALKHKTHVDTVLAFRKRYLASFGRKETNKRFLQYTEGVSTDWDIITAKIEKEYEDERARPGAKPYV